MTNLTPVQKRATTTQRKKIVAVMQCLRENKGFYKTKNTSPDLLNKELMLEALYEILNNNTEVLQCLFSKTKDMISPRPVYSGTEDQYGNQY